MQEVEGSGVLERNGARGLHMRKELGVVGTRFSLRT